MSVKPVETNRESAMRKISPKNRPSMESRNPEGKSKLSDKYKYVRFVEKKKVIRKMRQLQRELQSNTCDEARINADLSELRKDLMYIEKFPGNQKYISLFPSEGQLSEECRKKQQEIRAMIVNLTKKADESANKRKFDAVKNDDFFASVDNIEKPAQDPVVTQSRAPRKLPQEALKKEKENKMHPSWAAKTQNDKLTGSLAQVKFEGNRVVFDEDE